MVMIKEAVLALAMLGYATEATISGTQKVVEEIEKELQHPENWEAIVPTPGKRGREGVCKGLNNVAFRPEWYVDLVGDQFVGFCCDGEFFDIFCSEQCSCPKNAGITCYRGNREGGCTGTASISGVGPFNYTGTSAHCKVRNDPNFGDFIVDIDAVSFCSHYKKMDIVPPVKRKYPIKEEEGSFELIVDPDTKESNTGLVMTHAALIPNTSEVVLWTRVQKPDVANSPGVEETVSTVFNAVTGKYKAVNLTSNAFCSGLSYLSDGTIVAMGGEATDVDWGHRWAPWVEEGRNKIRYFDRETYEWTVLEEELPGNHWYPTQLTFEDDRIVNVGGFETMWGPANKIVEIFDGKTKKVAKAYQETHFSHAVGDMNLYPYLSILPYSDSTRPDDSYFFQFICNYGEITRLTKDNRLETVQVIDNLPDTICSHFSGMGSGKMLALHWEDNFAPEFVSFGGASINPFDLLNCFNDVPALSTSFRLKLNMTGLAEGSESSMSNVDWEIEHMPFPRVGGTAVVLPNGQVVLLNGAAAGLGNQMQTKPVLNAVLYDPYKPAHQRYKMLASTSIPRTYHSNALLMPDGNVLIGGGDQGVAYSGNNGGPLCASNYEYELRAELFKPPYAFSRHRVSDVRVENPEHEVSFGEQVTVHFTPQPGTNITGASLVYPSAATHSTDMSGRVVILRVSDVDVDAGTAVVHLPTKLSRATIPGWHMLFLLADNNQVPSKDSAWVQIQ